MKHCAIVGINWGDEGKGRMVDYIAEQYDVVVRYQGGNNAGHTVVNAYGEFALNLLPSGIFREKTRNLLGTGTVIDIEHLCKEIARLRERGIKISPANLSISDRAIICLPVHRLQDGLEEDRLKGAKFGSTRRGISPVYGDKYMKKGLQMGELLYPDRLRERVELIADWKTTTVSSVYNIAPVTADEIMAWLAEYGEQLKPYICDAYELLSGAEKAGKHILFEAQLGALRDIDYGIYPYTSSSSPLASYAPIGSGYPGVKIDRVMGIIKAYSTCVGEGPFVGELLNEMGDQMRQWGGEYGAATGRPRRIAFFDAVASRHGVLLQGATELALTKLDILSNLNEIPVCVAYKIKGKMTDKFPLTPELYGAEPVFEVMEGWKCDVTKARKFSDLPVAAQKYVDWIEKRMECPITFVSVGPGRDELIKR